MKTKGENTHNSKYSDCETDMLDLALRPLPAEADLDQKMQQRGLSTAHAK
jgi:hypothetical protein